MERVLFVACFLFAAWNVWHIATAPLLTIVRHLPDDTFYYLEISRNLGLLGRSSFDAGQTVTTGYHPLWAWICVFLGRLVSYQRMGMLRAMIAVSGVLSLGMAAVAGGLAWRYARTTLPIVTLLLTSFSYLNNSVGAMEWCVVIVISTATLWLLIRAPCMGKGPAAAGLAMLGVLGSLARSDFGGQAVGYLAASVLVWRLCRDRRYIVPSSILLMGTSAGLGIAMWYDHSISGSWLKGSAHMKQLWGVA